MNEFFLSQTPLFKGVTNDEIREMLDCFHAGTKKYKKGQVIYTIGDKVSALGLILTGSANIETNDIWGNKSILAHIEQGELFAETYACLGEEPLMVNVVAASESNILFLHMDKILTSCSSACNCHSKVIKNLLSITSQKNIQLSRRIFHTASKSIRGRLLSYFSYQVQRQGSYEFSIPFNRQELADYLAVDRSAMSNELSKMRREGILTFEKNKFNLKEILHENNG